MSTDRLRQQCEKMLASDEEILLDAECRLFQSKTKSLFGRGGYGRAFLTGRRLIWIKRRVLAIENLLPRRLPDVVETDLLSIERMRLLTGGLGLSGLEVNMMISATRVTSGEGRSPSCSGIRGQRGSGSAP